MNLFKNNNGEWIEGWSWTPGRWETTTNPDGTTEKIYVHGGPFLYLPYWFKLPFTDRWIWLYAGFRPTPPWTHGGDEGLWVGFKRFMQKIGWANLGFALRLRSTPNDVLPIRRPGIFYRNGLLMSGV